MAFSIVFVLFPDVTQLDMTGPAQILCRLPESEVHFAASTMEAVPTDCGFSINPTTTFDKVARADLLCVPGGMGVVGAMADRRLLSAIQRLAKTARYTTSVCTGALILGVAGLLDGKKATTHWAYHHLLSLVGATPVEDRVVRDGNTFTGGGVTAGIDFGLTVLAELAGETFARTIATAVEYDPAPPFGRGVLTDQPSAVSDTLSVVYQERAALVRGAMMKVGVAP
ncbi:MAG: DJ-1/PfpI family protein [Pseudomonadota bacterium]